MSCATVNFLFCSCIYSTNLLKRWLTEESLRGHRFVKKTLPVLFLAPAVCVWAGLRSRDGLRRINEQHGWLFVTAAHDTSPVILQHFWFFIIIKLQSHIHAMSNLSPSREEDYWNEWCTGVAEMHICLICLIPHKSHKVCLYEEAHKS